MKMPEWINRLRAWWNFQGIVHHYHKQGSLTPLWDAMQEVDIRADLERLRDFASDAYLKDGSKTVEQLKQAWFDDYLKPHAGCYTVDRMRMTRKIVKEMPVFELFHPDALRKWEASVAAIVKKHAPKATWDKYQKRVLRG